MAVHDAYDLKRIQSRIKLINQGFYHLRRNAHGLCAVMDLSTKNILQNGLQTTLK